MSNSVKPMIPAKTDAAARAAIKEFRALKPTLDAYARMLTGRTDIRIMVSHRDNGSTDGTTIFFRPPLALGDRSRHDRHLCDRRDPDTLLMRCQACATREDVLVTIYHELAHICFDTFAPASEADKQRAVEFAIGEVGGKWADQIKQRVYNERPKGFLQLAGLVNQYLPFLVNCLEDARVNRNMFLSRPGLRIMFEADTRKVFTDGFERVGPDGSVTTALWKDAPLNQQVLIGCYVKASGFVYDEWFDKDVMDALADLELSALIKQIETARKASSTYNLGFKILARLRELGFCATENDPDPEEEEQPDEPEDSDEPESSEEREPDSDPLPSDDGDSDESGDDVEDGDSPGEPESEPEDGSTDSDSSESEDESEPADDSGEDQEGDPVDGDSSESDNSDDAEGTDDSDEPSGESSSSESSEPGDGEDAGKPTDADGDSDQGQSDENGDSQGFNGESEPDGSRDEESPSGDSSDESTSGSEGDAGSGDSNLGSDDADDLGSLQGSPEDESVPSDSGSSSESESDEGVSSDSDALGEGDQEVQPVDSGADDGYGGTSIKDNPPKEMGTPEDMEPVVLKWLDHEDKPPSIEGEIEEAAIERAIVQGLYFTTPSSTIFGVREHLWGQPQMDGDLNYSRAWDETRSDKNKRLGRDTDLSIDEQLLQPAIGHMRRTFSDNQRGAHQRNLKSGRVDNAVLGKRAGLGDPRLFAKKILPGKKSYEVVIGMDISGSTIGRNIALEKRAIQAQANMLSRVGIPFSIYAHTGNYHDGYNTSSGLDLEIYHIKTVTEPWNDATQQRLAAIGPASANLDGHALEFLRKVADKSTATDKIIMYYSDGKMPAENHIEELEILTREIKHCRQRGITLLGVGIRTDSPKEHGLDTVIVEDDSDLVKVVKHLGKRLAENY